MRLLAVLLVAGLLAIPAGGTFIRVSDREREGLQGPVRVVHEETARLESKRGATVESRRSLVGISAYNADGDKVEHKRYADGELVERATMRYTSEGELVSDVAYRSSGVVFAMVSTKADAAAHKGDENWSSARTLAKFTYDRRGHRLGALVSDSSGRPANGEAKEAYTYDESERLVEVRRYGMRDGQLVSTTMYAYGKAGEVTGAETVRADGTSERRVRYDGYRYDGQKNWIKRVEEELSPTGTVRSRSATYRSIEYFERGQGAPEVKPPKDCPDVARCRGGADRSKALATASAKSFGEESQTMDTGGVFMSIRLREHYNEVKPSTPAVMAVRETASPRTRLRRVVRLRSTGDAIVVSGERPAETVPPAEIDTVKGLMPIR